MCPIGLRIGPCMFIHFSTNASEDAIAYSRFLVQALHLLSAHDVIWNGCILQWHWFLLCSRWFCVPFSLCRQMKIVGLMALPGILEQEKDVWDFFFLNFFEWGFLPFWFPSAPERAIRWVNRILVWEKRMERYRKEDIIKRDVFWGKGLCQ